MVLKVWSAGTVKDSLGSLAGMVLVIRLMLSLSSMIGHNSLLCLTQEGFNFIKPKQESTNRIIQIE